MTIVRVLVALLLIGLASAPAYSGSFGDGQGTVVQASNGQGTVVGPYYSLAIGDGQGVVV